ncbi:MAG: protein-methionine-sulfoxide reductase catalytic subunit MsrP [Anaerolineae bacterium]|nr:protein-methionine-sulfoxide reductase catalytic subunit MsrP [Anaerolineae bacterium]
MFRSNVPASEITPKEVYLSRRDFMKAAAVTAAGALLAACAPRASSASTPAPAPAVKLTDALTPLEDVTSYNNYYEFSGDKQAVGPLASDFHPRPWDVEVGGLVNNPKTYAIEDLLAKFPQEERVYRLRCVEAWSMVIPWTGFPLAKLLAEAQPASAARYVRFVSVLRPEEMPGQKSPFYQWPYQEGLRLDEAMNDLTLLATGLYGESLPNQNGAPIRLVVPWKYGFKSTDSQPETLWNTASPREYGFYSNVNPSVPHPRWSQASERRIGEFARRPTLMFNGYEKEVAYLYEGMDLKLNY